MFDNSKYHLVYGGNVPNVGKMKKVEVIEWMGSRMLDVYKDKTVLELKVELKKYIRENVRM